MIGHRLDDRAAHHLRYQRNDSVSERGKTVQPIGNPINASTNDGLRKTAGDPCAPACCIVRARWEATASVNCPSACVAPIVTAARFQSVAVGVGQADSDQSRIASVSVVPACPVSM